MQQYQSLLKVSVSHGYYRDGIPRDMDVFPSKETSTWFTQRGILLKMQGNLIHIIGPGGVKLDEVEGLKLFLTSGESMFWNFTEAPFNELGFFEFTNDNPEENAILVRTFQPRESQVIPTNAVACISIDFNKLNNQFSELPASYEARLEAREVSWSYLIVDQSGNGHAELHLEGSHSELFSGPTEETLPNNQKASLFGSGAKQFPLKEYPSQDLKLRYDEMSLSLPMASPSGLSLESGEGDTQRLVSRIYVYV